MTLMKRHQRYRDQNRAAFLFSMLKRRINNDDDATLEDRIQPLEPHESLIIECQPKNNGNGFNGNIYGVKKNGLLPPKTLYFASPMEDGSANGEDCVGKTHNNHHHLDLYSQETTHDANSHSELMNGESNNSYMEQLSRESETSTADASPYNSSTEDPINNYSIQNNTTSSSSFKESLLTGLEVQSAAHRARLLSDLLSGVKEGVMNAVDTENERVWFNEEKVRFWQFWRRGTSAAATIEADDSIVGDATPQEDVKIPESDGEVTKDLSLDNNIHSSKFASRTITGLINALAQEVENLEVKVDSDPTTPISNKTVHSIQIYFSRLGFEPLKFGNLSTSEPSSVSSREKKEVERITADEAFDRIDADQSGFLDAEELATALKMAAIMGSSNSGYIGIRSKEMLSEMATRLVKLYDTNGDGVVDREEYSVMVRDMAFLREKRLAEDEGTPTLDEEGGASEGAAKPKSGWFSSFFSIGDNNETSLTDNTIISTNETNSPGDVIDVTDNEVFWSLVDQGEGSIVLEDLRLDLRRLLFGAIPVFKRILPGGHLFLKPFTATLTASFNREDIMNSVLVDAGLRRLVARALSVRVRGVRDLFDGAVFYGRNWKLFQQNAPLVEVPKLEDVQFDGRNRLIITGRARIKAAPDSPFIENGFKLRTKIGTRSNGRIIGLLEPEIAVFAECPKALESRVRTSVKEWFDYTIPTLQPLYAFIPLQSPFKNKDKMNGFNLGEDNQINSIEIKNGKLCFEFKAILRPGRFLGSHYLAFTVPIRTLIITVDRVKEGIRNARRNKRAADKKAREKAKLLAEEACDDECALDELYSQSISGKSSISTEGRERLQKLEADFQAVEDSIESNESQKQKGFFSRFVEGYSGAQNDDELQINARLSSSISNFFGSQDNEEEN